LDFRISQSSVTRT